MSNVRRFAPEQKAEQRALLKQLHDQYYTTAAATQTNHTTIQPKEHAMISNAGFRPGSQREFVFSLLKDGAKQEAIIPKFVAKFKVKEGAAKRRVGDIAEIVKEHNLLGAAGKKIEAKKAEAKAEAKPVRSVPKPEKKVRKVKRAK